MEGTMINTLQSIFGQKFQVISDRGGDIHPSAKLKMFDSPLSARQFISGQLKTSPSEWRYFLQRQSSLISATNKLSDWQLIDKVAELVMRKNIRFYELPQISHRVMAHNGKGTGYNFIKGPENLPGNEKPLDIHIEATAIEILSSLEVERNYWDNYLKEHGLAQKSSLNTESQDTLSYVASLLVAGDIVVYTQPFSIAPPVPVEALDAIESMIDKKALLGPEVHVEDSIYINFQIDISEAGYRNDKLTLVHSGGKYESSLTLGMLQVFDFDWVRLEFPDPPHNGNYTLLFDAQEEGSDVYTLFEDVPFASLAELTPDLEAGA